MAIEKISEIWPEWRVTELIGEGTLAKVYRAVCDDTSEVCAVKVVSLPRDEADIEAMRAEGMSDIEIISYYSDVVNDIVTELKLAQALKDDPNIVKLYDYSVAEREGSIGWDILIRTELLVPLNKYMAVCPVTEADTVKMASDICSALEFCETLNVIHRDIKPESIFISEEGDFKLTDFTITKENGQTGSALSTRGGFVYLAPEIVAGGEYDTRADIYSIGLLMYKLCNGGFMPFVDESSSYEDRKNAVNRRLDGEALPEPRETTPELAGVILKACAFDPAQRYASAAEFRAALEELKDIVGFPIIAVDYQTMVAAGSIAVAAPVPPELDPDEKIDIDAPIADDENMGAVHVPSVAPEEDFTIDHSFSYDPPIRGKQKESKSGDKNKKKKIIIIVSISVAAALLIGLALFFILRGGNDDKSDPVTVSEQIITLLKEDKFDDVTELYRKYRGDKSKLYSAFMTRLDQIYTEFKENGQSGYYDDVIAELDYIESLDIKEISGKIASVREQVEALYASINGYEDGIAKEGVDYIEALRSFALVIPEDDAHYSDAQKRMEALVELICGEADSKVSHYPDAIEYINSALEALPENEKLKAKFEELKAAYLEKLLAEADEMIADEDYEDAFSKLNYALEVLGESEEIDERINTIIEKYIEDIDELAADKDYDEAIELVDEAIDLFAENESANETLTAKKNEMIESRYLDEIEELMVAREYEEAKTLLADALEELPESEALKEIETNFVNRIEADFSQEINDCLKQNRFVDAKELYNEALALCPESAVVAELLNTINEAVDEFYSEQIMKLLDKYDFDSATETLNEWRSLYPESEELAQLQEVIIDEMEQFYIDEADNLVDAYDYYGAIALLEKANELLPSNERIMNKLTELEQNAPADLADIDCSDSSYVKVKNSETTDCFDNSYAKSVSFNANKKAFAEYELDGDYSRFTATIFTTSNMSKSIYIYLDGSSTPVKEYHDITDDTEPIALNIDVSGCSSMRIEVEGSLFAVSTRYVELGNPVLYK